MEDAVEERVVVLLSMVTENDAFLGPIDSSFALKRYAPITTDVR